MGVCDWLKRISRNKRKKEIAPIKLKIRPHSINLKGAKNGYPMVNKSGIHVSSREATGLSLITKEMAATRIQTAFRAYKARKTLRYLKEISRFRNALTKQASTALEKLHFWSKIHMEIRKQMKLEDRLEIESKLRELERKWCTSPQIIMETESKILHREKAAQKRERALPYAFSHQWRANSSRYFGQAYYDLSKESWGWKWAERWIAVYRLGAHVVVRPIVSQRAVVRKKPCERKKMVAVKCQMENGRSVNL